MPTFLIEFFQRLLAKSPKFFFILQCFAVGLVILGYVPSMLDRWTNIIVSSHFRVFAADVSKYAIGFFIALKLPVKGDTPALSERGEILKSIDKQQLPFTAQAEIKDAQKPGGVLNDQTQTKAEIITKPIS